MKIGKCMKIILAVCFSIASLAGAGIVEQPSAMPDAMVSVTVSDLHGFIDGIGSVAAQVSPMASGMMIKSMAGMQLGDPGLAGIAPGKGLAIVALDQSNIFAIVEVGEAQAPTYTATLSQKGLHAKYADGVLVVAKDAAQVDKGVSEIVAVKDALLAKRSPDLRVVAQPAAMIEKNKAQIDGMMQMMPMLIGMGMAQSSPGMDPASAQGLLRILEGEIRIFRSLAEQCATAEIVLAPNAGSLQFSEIFAAKPGTRLATLMNAPKVNQPNPGIQAGLLGNAAIAVDSTMSNPEAFTSFLIEEMDLLLNEMGLESSAPLKDCIKKWMGLFNGSFSETVGFGGKNFVDVNYVLAVKDEASALSLLKSMEQDMAPFLDLYKSFGMPMSLKFLENVREHNGVKIHQFKVDVSMSPEQLAAAGAMNMNLSNMVYDVAICDGLMLYSMGGAGIETLIDRVKDAGFQADPLKARSIYPANGFYYCDVDVAKYMAGIASILPQDPNNPMPQLATLLQGADPVTSAGFRDDGLVMWSVNIPGSLIGKVGQAAMMMQMQQMQQAQSMPLSGNPMGIPGDVSTQAPPP